jgi:hypothetical protein
VRTLSLEGLWFQLGAAALLWFESNADSAKISLIVRELRRAPLSPKTFAEKAMGWFDRVLDLVIKLLFGLFAVTFALVLTTKFSSWQLAKAELLWVGSIVSGLAGASILGRCIYRYETNLRKLLRQPRRSDTPETDDEMTVRRSLRSIAFVLFFVSTVSQLVVVAL